MHSQFLAADVYGEFFRAFTDFFGGYFNTIGQYVAEAFSLHHLFCHRYDRPVISPGEFEAVRVRLIDKSVFVTFDSECHRCATGDCIQSVAVA